MKARHKKDQGGGSQATGVKEMEYTKESNVLDEAKERKRGGKVHGSKGGHRLDKRARGGRTGSDKSPFASSSHTSASKSMKQPQGA